MQDATKDPVKLVTPANVIDGTFTYEGTALRARHSQALVTWNDPDNDGKATPAIWLDTDAQVRFGRRQADVLKWGCTSEAEAIAFARWVIDTEQSQDQIVSYKASLDHADLMPGDVIAVQDPSIIGARFGGRINSCTSTTVTLDQAVTLEAGQTYSISVAGADGKPINRSITTAAGTTDLITITPALDAPLPAAGAMWAIFSTSLPARLFSVVNNRQLEINVFQITAALFDPTKFPRVEEDFTLPPKRYSLLRTGVIAPPTGLAVKEYLYEAGPSVKSAALVSWEAPKDPRVLGYDFASKGPADSDYIQRAGQVAPTATMQDVIAGTWSFRVRAYDDLGQRSAWAQLDAALLSLSEPPSDVGGLRLAIQGNQVMASWPAVLDLDLWHYRIRHTTALTGAIWANAIDLVEQATGTQASMPAIGGTYLIKAVDTQGNESQNATMAVLDPTLLADVNVVVTLEQAPAWAGTKTNLEAAGGVLQLLGDPIVNWSTLAAVAALAWGINGPAASGIYQIAAPFDMGAVYGARISAAISATAGDLQDRMANWVTLADVASLAGLGADDWGIQLQVRTTNDNPGGSPTWSDWADVVVGNYNFRGLDARLLVDRYHPAAQVYVAGLALTIDMDDRRIKLEDQPCPAAGLTIAFVPPFREIPNVQMTPQDLLTGDTWEITGKTKSSVTINFYNAAAAGVARTFDLTVTGYGVEQ